MGWFAPDGSCFIDLELITVCLWSENDHGEDTLYVRLRGMEDVRINDLELNDLELNDLELDEDRGESLMRALSEYRGYPGFTNPGRDT